MTFSAAISESYRFGCRITCDAWRYTNQYFEVDPVTKRLSYFNGENSEEVEAYIIALWAIADDWEIKNDGC